MKKFEKSQIKTVFLTYILCVAMPLSVKFCLKQIDAYNAQYNSQQFLNMLDEKRYADRMEERKQQEIAREKEKQEMDELVNKVMEMVNGENE
ncbi:hypothetical protein SAMN02910413_1158 [Pseudobutyrivibrio sp. C4]|uniref:hypothetical protein n=1 Tax=Pseudobutyrivibrio sp. C4 TaxID=1520803 RepID=UPI0008B508A2|nr:hypothetical protein [Pseudobutyrivibrio sp. C4]SES89649.1 hypothetical protein SAMN02910413_1158 [Pseudobutyrivibrio sp. C4]